jgi:Low-density lipoprotein receptor repeat class B
LFGHAITRTILKIEGTGELFAAARGHRSIPVLAPTLSFNIVGGIHGTVAEAGHIYWTNMGIPNLSDGSIERADIDGKNRKTIVTQGATYTPKQIILDKKGGKRAS